MTQPERKRLIDRLWTETLRHRPFDIALAFVLSCVVAGAAASMVAGSRTPTQPTNTTPPTRTTVREQPTETGPSRAPTQYGRLIVAPLNLGDVRTLRTNIEQGLIGGLARAVPTEDAGWDEAQYTRYRDAFATLNRASPRDLVRVGLIAEDANRDLIERYMCGDGKLEPVTRLADRANRMGMTILFGATMNRERTCRYDLDRIDAVRRTFASVGIAVVARGWQNTKAIVSRTAALTLDVSLVAPSEVNTVGRADWAQLAQTPATVVVQHLESPEAVRSAQRHCPSLTPDADLVLRCAALNSTALMLYTGGQAWKTAALSLDEFSKENDTTRQRLKKALAARENITAVEISAASG